LLIKKKLASYIYDYVLDKMNLNCNKCIIIENSEISFKSATLAGLKTVITLSEYNNTKTLRAS